MKEPRSGQAAGQAAADSAAHDTGPGDEFATAMACLILQLPDAFLPIFQR